MSRRDILCAMCLLPALGLAAALVPGAARAEDSLGRVASRLVDVQVIRGRFEQTRRLSGFVNPLVSRGDFVVARGHGVLWNTSEPLRSSLLVTSDRLVVRGADGKVQQQMQADTQPAMRVMGESIIAVLRSDLRSLSARFEVSGQAIGKTRWELTLTPTDAGVRRAFARIELSGDRFVREVRLEEASGDSTVVRMIGPVAGDRLTPDEEQRFE